MTEAQKRAYILADNRIAEEASWAKDLLTTEIHDLIELGFDTELTGFDTLEIDTLFAVEPNDPKANDNVEIDPKGPIICRAGDLWVIGKHRLYIGDAREAASYEILMAGEKAQLVLTDAPYGCKIAGNVSGLGRVKHEDFLMGATGKLDAEFSHGLLRPSFERLRENSQPGAIAFLFMDWRGAPFLQDAAKGVFEEMKNLIVWVKTNAGMGSFFRSAHELIFAYKISAGKHINNFGLRKHRTNVWTYEGANVFRAGRLQDLADHSTVKPKKLIADAIKDCSHRGGIVLDCYAGSGTTLVAAEMTGRRGHGIELDPKYGDVILRRVAKTSGETPMLDGKTPYDEVAAQRTSEVSIAEASDDE